MSFYNLPSPWNPGYAIPEYVMAEPPERGTFTTQWLPRGTISQLVPDVIAKPGRKLLGRNDAGLGSLGRDSLGADHPVNAQPAIDGLVAAAAAQQKAAQDAAAARTIKVAVVGAGVLVAFMVFGSKKRRRK